MRKIEISNIETNLEIIDMVNLADKFFKNDFTDTLHMFTKVEENMTMIRREKRYKKDTNRKS